MPSIEAIVMTSLKKRIQKSPLLSRDKPFLDSIKIKNIGGKLVIEYEDEDGIIKESTSEDSSEVSDDSDSESSESSQETSVKITVDPKLKLFKSLKKQVIEDGLKDSIPKILEKLIFK
jgi:hypothetical protein